MRSRSLAAYLVVGLYLLAAPAFSQNLVTNANFDAVSQISGWASFGSALPGDGSRGWSAADAGASALSGSAHLTLAAGSAAGAVIGLSQCHDISSAASFPPGSSYRFYASVNTPGSQSTESRAVIEAAFFSDASCTASLPFGEGQGAVATHYASVASPPWPSFPGSASTGGIEASAIAPPGANGIQLRLYLERTSGAAQQDFLFDTVVLHLFGTTPITLTSFEAE